MCISCYMVSPTDFPIVANDPFGPVDHRAASRLNIGRAASVVPIWGPFRATLLPIDNSISALTAGDPSLARHIPFPTGTQVIRNKSRRQLQRAPGESSACRWRRVCGYVAAIHLSSDGRGGAPLFPTTWFLLLSFSLRFVFLAVSVGSIPSGGFYPTLIFSKYRRCYLGGLEIAPLKRATSAFFAAYGHSCLKRRALSQHVAWRLVMPLADALSPQTANPSLLSLSPGIFPRLEFGVSHPPTASPNAPFGLNSHFLPLESNGPLLPLLSGVFVGLGSTYA